MSENERKWVKMNENEWINLNQLSYVLCLWVPKLQERHTEAAVFHLAPLLDALHVGVA